MSIYRFVGSHSEMGDKKLTKFGQTIELSESEGPLAIGTHNAPGPPLLPAEEFDAIGFTEQELSLYSDPYTHSVANEAFQAKKRKALERLHEMRERAEPQPASTEPDIAA